MFFFLLLLASWTHFSLLSSRRRGYPVSFRSRGRAKVKSWIGRKVISEETFCCVGSARNRRSSAAGGASGRVGHGATRGQRILSSLEEDHLRVHVQFTEASVQAEVRFRRLQEETLAFKESLMEARYPLAGPRCIMDSLLFAADQSRICWIRLCNHRQEFASGESSRSIRGSWRKRYRKCTTL